MRAEVIAIGDELITGQRLDTNSQWLSERLTELGVEVAFHTTIGDRLADNIAAFKGALQRADVIVATGGLGPTADDLTREALAAATGVELIRDEDSLAHIRNLFASRSRTMPDRNMAQADFPAGAKPIRNEHGTAPGIAMRIDRPGTAALVFALPGVPAELKPMWFDSVAPAIQAAQPAPQVIRHRRLKCFGVGESALEAMLPDLIRRGRDPVVGITVSDATITLRVTAAGKDYAACQRQIEPTEALIRHALGNLVFGEEDDELEHAVVRLLSMLGKTVAVAEWATGGLISQWLADADREFRAASSPQPLYSALVSGSTASSLEAWRQLLDLAALNPTAEPDSAEVAMALAEAIRRRTGADFALGVAAFPARPDAPEARLHISIAGPDRTRRLRFGCASHPAIRRPRAGKQALNALRLVLLDQEPTDG